MTSTMRTSRDRGGGGGDPKKTKIRWATPKETAPLMMSSLTKLFHLARLQSFVCSTFCFVLFQLT